MFNISDTLLKAISWTLVHTIWQGFILAFLAGIVILMTKKAPSVLRYNLLSGLFLVFIVVVGLTFGYEYQNGNEEQITSLNFSIDNLKAVWTIENGTVSNNFSTVVINFLNANANTIVLIWFIVFSIKSFNICSNLSHVYKIRNYRNQPVSEYWKARLEELCKTIHINKHIILLESQLVKVPSVTGFFKPIILLPIGLLSNLPQDQIEAILLHELAHIRRKDYFVNLIQNFAEIVFFFNPGVLWLSSLIKEERENCCDDIAVSVTKCKAKFVHALVSFQEYNMKNNELIMGFGGKKNHLLNRAKRIINNDTKSLNTLEKTFLSIAVFAVVLVMIACSNSKLSEVNEQSSEPKAKVVSSDEMRKANIDIYNKIVDKKKTEPVLKEIKLLSGLQKSNAQSNSEYCPIVAPQAGPLTEADSRTQDAMIDAQKAALKKEKDQLKSNLKTFLKVKNENQAEMDKEKAKEAFQKVQFDIQKAKSESDEAKSKTATTYEKTAVTKTDNKKQVTERIAITSDNILDSPDDMSDAIIMDLKIDKIISGKSNLSYNLSKTKFVVNGVVQSDSVHAKFKKKYLAQIQQNHRTSHNISICYNYDISNLVACN